MRERRVLIESADYPAVEAVAFNLGGVEFSLDVSLLTPKARRTYRRLAERGEPYEPVMTRCLTKLLGSLAEPRFMDIGGFAGYYTCYAAALLGPDSPPVYCVESNRLYCDAVRRSCELSGIDNAEIVLAALSDVVEPVVIADRGVIVTDEDRNDDETVATVTLDSLCEAESIVPPNIIKMDIHGSEGKALLGMSSILQQMDYLLLELHGEFRLEEFSPGLRRSDVMDYLWDQGMSVYHIAGHRAPSMCFAEGRFSYVEVSKENVEYLFFDRGIDLFLIVTPRDDLPGALGNSLTNSEGTGRYFCY